MCDTTLSELADHLRERSKDRRTICAIAGAPGSGKSTAAAALCDALNAKQSGIANVLPMDGYHYDDLYLEPAGLRPRKGAPETFDVAGLQHMLARLRADDEEQIAVPVFDRTLEIARAGARLIHSSARIILVEGNYLLVDALPWWGLRRFFDVTVMIEVPEPVLRDRLRARWEGYDLAEDEIAQKLDANDLPNGRFVRDRSGPPHYVIRQG